MHSMKQRRYGKRFTVLLWIVLILVVLLWWSLFISGPSRVYEVKQEKAISTIEKENSGITGLTVHRFDYTTYQGYTDSTLYWFDENGDTITTRAIETLDYDKAKEVAKETYGITCQTITLGYGYNNPVYEIRGKKRMILIDYDTFERVYQREV